MSLVTLEEEEMRHIALVTLACFVTMSCVSSEVSGDEAVSKRVSYSTSESKYLDAVTTVSGTLSIPSDKGCPRS